MELSNPQWETFALHVAGGANKTEAARRAGYSMGAGNQGSRLAKYPAIVERVEQLRRESAQDATKDKKHSPEAIHLSKPYIVNKLVETYEDAKKAKQYPVCITSLQTLARIGGLIDSSSSGRPSVKTTTNITFNVNELNANLKAQLDEVSPSERQRLLEGNPDLAALMGGKVIDVEPAEDERAW
jgi:hypothetical protein